MRDINLAFVTIVSLLLVLPTSSPANVAPESGIIIHVQPVSGTCATSITDCFQIVRSTTLDGQLEFLIFAMVGSLAWGGQSYCVDEIHVGLTLPDNWQLVSAEQCGGYRLVVSGRSQLALDLYWWGYGPWLPPSYGGVVPVARLVVNVNGAGAIDFYNIAGGNRVVLLEQCSGAPVVTYPALAGAEAATGCEYTRVHCTESATCAAWFAQPNLALSAPPGGIAEGMVEFWACHYGDACGESINTGADWCSAAITIPGDCTDMQLHVTASAGVLPPGVYTTEIQLTNGDVARCLPVQFTVEGSPTATQPVTWGRVKSVFR